MSRSLIAILGLALTTNVMAESDVPSEPVPVRIVQSGNGYVLLRGGEPYTIRGAGMEFGDLEQFARHGGNSIRTWTSLDVNGSTAELLDAAYIHGVTVALTLPMASERQGFDYDDSRAVAEQHELIRSEVLKYRDHPALLFWIIGNELNHSYTNPRVYDAVNDVTRMIAELDPHHPTTTTLADFDADVVRTVQQRAPELDFLSFQVYGRLFDLPDAVAEASFTEPFMVTEWGAIGYWEMETTDWGAPVEMTSSEKAATFRRGHDEVLASFGRQLLGSYVFLWGQKQERTPTWFGMFTETGEATESVDVMREVWAGSGTPNRAPKLHGMWLDGSTSRQSVSLRPGQTYQALVDVSDPDEDSLRFHWEVKPESEASEVAGDSEPRIGNLEGLLSDPASRAPSLVAPGPGNYRLFAYVYDGQGAAAHANIPFEVSMGFAQSRDDLIAGEVMAIAYSGYREGQHPDRGDGAINPSRAEVLEDLRILLAHDFRLLRMYDAGDNTHMTLDLIRQHQLPMTVLLGIWLKAEISNHAANEWLTAPIPAAELTANAAWNDAEVERGIALANEYRDLVVAVNVGNEALVDWTDHKLATDRVIDIVRQVKAQIRQPVTVAENYAWWARDGADLAAELDFIGVHTYPIWEQKTIDEAMAYTIDNVEGVYAALPDKPIAILEAGWASVGNELGTLANEAGQARYYEEIEAWASTVNATVFFFEAFDEPWKGDPGNPLGAEKHWGLFDVDRRPKQVMRDR